MPVPSIKLCGLNTSDALDAAIKARADYAGFVFFPPSPRNLTLAQAAQFSERADGRIGRVGVFVDSGDSFISEVLAAVKLDAIQLHGKETPKRAAQIRTRFGLPVWKALPVAIREDVAHANTYAGAADLVLFDAKTPPGTLPGGMGLAFDWRLVVGWQSAVAWGIAGGLTPDNVAEAARLTSAPLLDTSSGIESAPGIKDVDRIAAFAYAARNP